MYLNKNGFRRSPFFDRIKAVTKKKEGLILNYNKRFMTYVKKEAKWYIFTFISSVFRFLIPLFVPLIFKYIFDTLLQSKTLSISEKIHQLLLIGIVVIAIFLLIRMPMEYIRQYCMNTGNNNIIKALRRDVFAKIHALDAKYFVENKSGEIGARFSDDIEKVRGYLTAAFSNIWIEMIVLIFVIIVMFTMNVKLTLLAMMLVGFQFIYANFLRTKFKKITKDMMKYRSILNGFILEKIQGALISKLFGAEKKDREGLDTHLNAYEKLTNKHTKINAKTISSINVLNDITPFVIIVISSYFVIKGNLTLGSLMAFYAYVDRMRAPVYALIQAFPAMTEGTVALTRLFEFFDIKPEIKEKGNAIELNNFQSTITFKNVSFSYNEKSELFESLNFTIEKGKTYAFVGESGGGKSTILQLLIRMYDVKSGEILLDGKNIKDYSLTSLRNQMGVVTQDNFLYSSSIKENIKMAKIGATDEEMILASKKAFANEFIEPLEKGYDTEIGERGIKLSGGQKQRIALSRVFLKNPSIILLDEATSALDNESEKYVQQSIEEIEKDKTVIIIAHRLSTIVHADVIFVVRNGEIIESGNHEELLNLNGYYKDLYTRRSQ
jgi:subfamily B ATP-binding cassette protein MsbA